MALLEHQEEASPKLVEKPATFHDADAADQLVYQLVRVEEDGTVVPASEDEVIEMESFLEEGTAIQVSDVEGTQMNMNDEEGIVCEREDSLGSKDKSSVGSQHLDGLESERKKLLAQLAFLDALLQKLKEEERACSGVDAVGYSELTKSYGDHHAKQQISAFVDLDGKWESKSDTNIMSPDISDDPCQKQTISAMEQTANSRANLRDLESPSSTSKHNWTSISNGSSFRENPLHAGITDDKREISKDLDCDWFKGNISLDKLSIRELHEAFRTTFGQQTSVKDKQWLKRRISMGLGGSLEITSVEGAPDGCPMLAIADDAPGVLRPGTSPAEEQALCAPETGHVAGNSSPEAAFSMLADSKPLEHKKVAGNRSPEAAFSSPVDPKFLEHKKRSPRVAHQFIITGDSENIEKKDQVQLSRDEGKRKRKPTKRYIEELAASDTRDVIGKAAAAKDYNQEKIELNISNKEHFQDQGKQTATGNTGISEMKFRTGYRRRRGRPRKSGNMFLTSNSSGRAAQLVRKAISVRTSRLSGKLTLTEPRVKIKPLPNDTMDVASESSIPPPKDNADMISNLPDLKSSEADTDTILSGTGGSQKKHHHPWTLREVMKLLEGVTHCGVGKWADIKKFSFSNCVYRSSTDLKDKWRNLVRASNTHYKMISQGEHRRKQSASPVPGPILIQVHDLAVQRGQSFSVNTDGGISRSGRSVPKRHLI